MNHGLSLNTSINLGVVKMKEFRLSRSEYLEYLENSFSHKELIEEVFFNIITIDQCAEITEHFCRYYELEYPDEVTEKNLYCETW